MKASKDIVDLAYKDGKPNEAAHTYQIYKNILHIAAYAQESGCSYTLKYNQLNYALTLIKEQVEARAINTDLGAAFKLAQAELEKQINLATAVEDFF